MDNSYRFAHSLQEGIKDFLKYIGFSSDLIERLDTIIYLFLILVIAFLIAWVIKLILIFPVRHLLRYKKIKSLKLAMRQRIFSHITWAIPPLIIIPLLPLALKNDPNTLDLMEKICWIAFIIALFTTFNSLIKVLWDIFSQTDKVRSRPIKGMVQIVQGALFFIAVIIIFSIILGKSPVALITGLGAFAAVLMLIFKDSILGFVAGVQLGQNDMVRIGDWIVVANNMANGVVMDITLNTVKVQNFDNTIVTIPPYSLISGAFQNWRGMVESGGRRIMRSYNIDLNTVHFCTPEMLENFKSIPILKEFIEKKQEQQAEGKVMNTENKAGLVNGTIETNLGLFRAYLALYLKQHPFINQSLTLMVRTLEPDVNGIPLQIYCFSSDKVWESYESIQAEILEHTAAMLPRFELYPFQNASGRDYINSAMITAGKSILDLSGIPDGTLKVQPSKPNVQIQQSTNSQTGNIDSEN